MDQPPAPDLGQSPPSRNITKTPRPVHTTAVDGSWQQLRDRRREKLQLSCSFCRSRKVKCDRQLPCNTCKTRGISLSCTYPSMLGSDSSTPRKINKINNNDNISVCERIHRLETLVRSLMQQQGLLRNCPDVVTATPKIGPTTTLENPRPQQVLEDTCSARVSPASTAPAAVAEDDSFSVSMRNVSLSPSRTPSESGSMLRYTHGATYVGNVHWAAVLESISELREHYEEREGASMTMPTGTSSNYMSHTSSAGPRLLYAPVQATKAEILTSIPSRQVVDRMVTRYFNTQYNVSLPVLHRGRFLREYEKFWQAPASASMLWIGLLFSIMALGTHLQLCTDDQPSSDITARAYVFRERTIHCLRLGQFTRGKEDVLETMLNYLFLEILLCKDADNGLWLVLGMIVQLALSLGYHRDAKNFSRSKISPFAGEMRRRVWAVIVQTDLRLSSQIGLPRLLKLHQCDTADPHNLLDTDFDETTVELPPSRPESEVTPVLYVLAKNRIDRLSDLISSYVNMADNGEHAYAETIELDRKLQQGITSLPAIFQWQPVTVSQSMMLSPQIIAHRVLFHLSKQRLTIWLHRRYLEPPYVDAQYRYSRNACVQAAMEILQLQKLIDEETYPDGLLYSVRFLVVTSLAQFVFLLGMSILSYYLQLLKIQPDAASLQNEPDENRKKDENEKEMVIDQDQDARVARIYSLLRDSHSIWLRSGSVSREARKAAKHLSLVLGLREQEEDLSSVTTTTTGENIVAAAAEATAAAAATTSTTMSPTSFPLNFMASQDTPFSSPCDQVSWDAYQAPISGEFENPPSFAPSFSVDVSMADLLMQNSTDWMSG